jgi:hypothetical protein
MEGSPAPENKDICMAIATRLFAIRVEVAKGHGPSDGFCPLCGIPELETQIVFTYPAAWFLWSYV